MDISEVSPDDSATCAEVVAVLEAAYGADCPGATAPTPRGYAASLRYGWDGDPGKGYVARAADGAVVGVLKANLPTYDNTNLAWFDLEVHPAHRGRGHGSELLRSGLDQARAGGRTIIGLSQWDLPKADKFARQHGFEPKAVQVSRRQELAAIDWETLHKLYDEAVRASVGYELIRLTGALPQELLDGMVALTASINDAPRDDLDMEDDQYSTERLRAYEAAQAAHDHTIYRVVARERATGALAGHSTIVVERERPQLGHQHDTAVDRAHRGHRLGALVKADMLRWMREAEPGLAQVDTWNTESNDHMIAINEQLGYRILGRGIAYQRSL
jgi:GNAT superfamily N-acetyltransferase